MKTFVLVLVSMLLVGCASGGLLRTAETTVHLKLLDAEFDAVVQKIDNLPLTTNERASMDEAVAVLMVQRDTLRELHTQNAGRIALSIAQSQTILDRIEAEVKSARIVYQGYVERSPSAAIDPQLMAYWNSAVIARDNIQLAISSGVGVSPETFMQYFGLALRAIAAVNGVPLVQADAHDARV